MRSPSLEPAAAAPIPCAGVFGRVRVAHGARGPRRVVGAGLSRHGRLRALVAALPEPLLHQLMPAREGAAALSREADGVHGGVGSAEIWSPPARAVASTEVPGTTVRVRFELKEQCTFGHSFHLVGDVPALGLWEPASAIALDWSEGHNWTVEKDLPANRLIEFKFLLRDSEGKIHWQNGPNRTLQTGATTKTLVVYEDWGNAKNQKVEEEGDTPAEMMETVVADDDQRRNGVVLANELQVGDNQDIKEPASAGMILRGGAFGRVRVAYGAGLAGTTGRLSVLVTALPKPLVQLMPMQEGAVALAPKADEVRGGVASAEISSPPAPAVPGSTVRVRFVLKEQCTFGHSFHLVGDVPALGIWEPTNAVALDWSEGHDWTVEKDLPANRLIEFKFLLQDSLGKFRWQNGPNRSLQIGETTNTLVVYEDWGNAKNQKVVEEGDTRVEMMEAVVADDDQGKNGVVSDNELQMGDQGKNGVVSANELQMGDNQEIKEGKSSISDDENSVAAAIASVGEETVKACEADQPELMLDEHKIQDELHDEIDITPQNGSATTYADNDYNDSILSKNGVLIKNGLAGAFERELLWGWKALQQLVGFKMDT